MIQIVAATVFLNLEGSYLDIRCFTTCLEHPLIFFKFHAAKLFSKYGHQSLDW